MININKFNQALIYINFEDPTVDLLFVIIGYST